MGSSTRGAVWASASTAFSAVLYLFDVGTTISALRTYFFYQYICSGLTDDSTAYVDDPVCQSIRLGLAEFHGTYMVFWLSLSLFALAHLTSPFIFYLTLRHRQHPLCVAYFLPLIHLHRLFKLLWRTRSRKSLIELQESQKESNSLYNVLGASLETAPQFVAQFLIAMKLGQSLDSSSDVHVFRTHGPFPPVLPPGISVFFDNGPLSGAVKIPNNLILSLVASVMSGTYSASMGILFLIEEQDMPVARRACVGILAGLQTLVVMLIQATLAAALNQFSDAGSITLLIYIIITLIVAWSFSTILIRSNYSDWQSKTKFLNVAHSLALAYMSIFTGPMYMIVKFGKSSGWLISATLLHVFAELTGVALVLFRPGPIKDRQSPCHSHPYIAFSFVATSKNTPIPDDIIVEEENKYLTCNVFLGTIFPLLFTFILTTMLFVWVHMNNVTLSCITSSIYRKVQSLKDFKKTSSRNRSALFKSKTFRL